MKDINISILVPAYNEGKRIPKFLGELIKFSSQNLTNFEVLIIDDGSNDDTKEVVLSLIKNHGNMKLLSYPENKGKGHAVLMGVLKAKGEFVLFIDADGSIKPKEILNMYDFYREHKYDIIVGSRISLTSNITNPQPSSRRLMSKFFNLYSNILFRIKINDLLCGFKGFSKNAAIQVFQNLKAFRWEFDVEILYRAKKNSLKVYQMPIEWKHEEGSKIKPLDPIFILLNLIVLRLRYL
ncbi:MAG: dolichyl-phosphate beta-glucosyltransferase [Promethearchaeota archaeon]